MHDCEMWQNLGFATWLSALTTATGAAAQMTPEPNSSDEGKALTLTQELPRRLHPRPLTPHLQPLPLRAPVLLGCVFQPNSSSFFPANSAAAHGWVRTPAWLDCSGAGGSGAQGPSTQGLTCWGNSGLYSKRSGSPLEGVVLERTRLTDAWKIHGLR